MPYLVYKVYPEKKLEYVETYEKFIEAKKVVKEMRTALVEEADLTVRLIFAKNQDEAERLLTEEREPRPEGEENN